MRPYAIRNAQCAQVQGDDVTGCIPTCRALKRQCEAGIVAECSMNVSPRIGLFCETHQDPLHRLARPGRCKTGDGHQPTGAQDSVAQFLSSKKMRGHAAQRGRPLYCAGRASAARRSAAFRHVRIHSHRALVITVLLVLSFGRASKAAECYRHSYN